MFAHDRVANTILGTRLSLGDKKKVSTSFRYRLSLDDNGKEKEKCIVRSRRIEGTVKVTRPSIYLEKNGTKRGEGGSGETATTICALLRF